MKWLIREVFVPLVISRLALTLIGWLAITLSNYRPVPGAWEIGPTGTIAMVQGRVSAVNHPVINMWSRWDGGWYFSIAKSGYTFGSSGRSNVGFFPVYPALIRALHSVVGWREDLYWLYAGMVASNLALVAALGYLFQMVKLEFDEATARRAVLYLLIFPTTLFLSAVYSESVFLALSIGSFYHARRREWWVAGLLGCAATLSRPTGIVVVVGLVLEYLLQCEFQWRKIRLNALAIVLIPLTLAGYFAYLHYAHGTGTAVIQAQSSWGVRLQNPWRTLAPFFRSGLERHGSNIDLGFILVFAALVLAIAIRLRASYAAYSFAYLIFILMWGSLNSSPRYVIGIFPAIILLAAIGRNPAFHRAYFPISAALAAWFMSVFAVWRWVA